MIPLPKPPKITNKKDNYACFIIEGLYPGYGITLGNALRRVLLSSLPGAAIVEVKIKGVSHEFSTLPHVVEDVINICLNLKKLRFKLHSEEAQKAQLKVKGEKEVTANDFDLPTQLELVNKDQHIATLTDKKAELQIEITVQQGIGYEPKEMRNKDKLEIGQISLDAVYTPIQRVSFNIENMRVGKRTDFDRLILGIETDGTIEPEQALGQALEILLSHFSLIEKENQKFLKKEKAKKPAKKKTPKKPAKKAAPKPAKKKTAPKKPAKKKKTTAKKTAKKK